MDSVCRESPNRGGEADLSSRRALVLLGGVVGLAAVVNLVWMLLDDRPPIWDAALHLTNARNLADLLANGEISARLLTVSPYYPPLFYFLALPFLTASAWPALWIFLHVFFLAVLAISVYTIAVRLWENRRLALLAAFLTLSFPHVQWLSREFMIDLEVIALSAAILALAVASQGFSRRWTTVVMGLVIGAGLLVKWSILFCCLAPLGWLVFQAVRQAPRRQRKPVLNNMLSAAVAAGVVAWPWYLLNVRFLASHFFSYTQGLGALEGDPGLWTLDGWTFYLRALLGHHLFLVFFLLFGFAMAYFWRRRTRPPGWGFLVTWLAGGYGIYSLFANKAPRHIAPLLPAVALIIAALVFRTGGVRRRLLLLVCLGTGAFQWWMVTFGVPFLPERLILWPKKEPAYQERVLLFRGERPAQERFESWPDGWYAYTQTAFGFWGGPAREDWRIEAILRRAGLHLGAGRAGNGQEAGAGKVPNTPGPELTGSGPKSKAPFRLCLGLVPDAARFNVWAFRERAVALNIRPALIWRVSSLSDPLGSNLDDYQFILVKSGNQGAFWSTVDNAKVSEFLASHPERFSSRESWRLPDGSQCWLYENAAFVDRGFDPGME